MDKKFNGAIAADGVELMYDAVINEKTGKPMNKSWYKYSRDGVIYKKCVICSKWYPLEAFAKNEKTGNAGCRCIHCIQAGKKIIRKNKNTKKKVSSKPKTENMKDSCKKLTMKEDMDALEMRVLIGLRQYQDAQLLRELRNRGYSGELTKVTKITV